MGRWVSRSSWAVVGFPRARRLPVRPARAAGRWGALLLVALLWYAAFSFIGVRYWGAAPSAAHPRPPVADEVWPDALRAF